MPVCHQDILTSLHSPRQPHIHTYIHAYIHTHTPAASVVLSEKDLLKAEAGPQVPTGPIAPKETNKRSAPFEAVDTEDEKILEKKSADSKHISTPEDVVIIPVEPANKDKDAFDRCVY